jgi:hypothetical protein
MIHPRTTLPDGQIILAQVLLVASRKKGESCKTNIMRLKAESWQIRFLS